MTGRSLRFNGVDYPDGEASDPRRLGWMTGSPPPSDKRIRFEDDDFFSFPKLRWTLSHIRELLPTARVWRGAGPASDLGPAPGASEAAIDTLGFEDMLGQPRRWDASLADTYTDGILVLHKGRRVYERYFGALQPERPHACFSVTKSYVGTLAALLVHEGALDDTRRVPHYLPEMRGTAFEDATLREVMDMQTGVAYSEDYANPQAQIWDHSRAGGLRPSRPGETGPRGFHEFLVRLRKEGEHGQAFAYKTPNTDVLAWILSRVSGQPLVELLSQRLWSRLGCEEDADITVDPVGTAFGGGGMAATLRDNARFGELMRLGGAREGLQVIPEAVVAGIARGADPARFAKAGYVLLPGYSYRSMWWVTHNEHDAFEARGIHGQRIYIAPKAEMVIARFCSHPIAASAGGDPITIPAFLALGRMLAG